MHTLPKWKNYNSFLLEEAWAEIWATFRHLVIIIIIIIIILAFKLNGLAIARKVL